MICGYAYVGEGSTLASVHLAVAAPVPPTPVVRDSTGDPRFRAPTIRRPRLRSPMHAAVDVIGVAEPVVHVTRARIYLGAFPVVRPVLRPTIGCVNAGARVRIRVGARPEMQLRHVTPRVSAKFTVAAMPAIAMQPPRLPNVRAVQNPSDDELIAAYLASRGDDDATS